MKIFIDGSAGTTGLRIKDRLMKRSDVELLTLGEKERKDPESRKRALNGADAAFLCLPDSAAVEAVGLVENPDTVIIDTSTAHRKANSRPRLPRRRLYSAGLSPRRSGRAKKRRAAQLLFPHGLQRRRQENDSRIRERGQIAPAVRPEAIRAFSTAQAPKGDGGHNRN